MESPCCGCPPRENTAHSLAPFGSYNAYSPRGPPSFAPQVCELVYFCRERPAGALLPRSQQSGSAGALCGRRRAL